MIIKMMPLFLLLLSSPLKGEEKQVNLVEVDSMINIGSAFHILAAIKKSESEKRPLIIRMDTPGGLLDSTRDIVKAILNAKVPVIVYIGPKGAHAGSAGVMITMAAHIAVMAPGTNIGAAHPVNFDGKDAGKDDIKKKIVNDTAAFARSIAKERGRNEVWAEEAVKDSNSITSREAVDTRVVDLIANDVNHLLEQVDGREITFDNSSPWILKTKGKKIHTIPMDLKHQFLSFLSHPNVAYLLMTFGGLGLYVELTHPGLIFPGAIGAIFIVLSLICFQAISVNYGALGLLLLGAGLLIAEIFVTSFGVLGISGIVAFLIGSFFLVDASFSGVGVSPEVIWPTAFAFFIIMLGIGYLLNQIRSLKPRGGVNSMLGLTGVLEQTVEADKIFQITIRGEIWKAVCPVELTQGTSFVIDKVEGMTLHIKEQESSSTENK